jgi:phosphoribosylaminoimidazolecarboxamide formyltransferase/IMP cyclohydrolase
MEISKDTRKVAFISVFNKEGIDKFAEGLVNLGWEIMSSSGTAKYLKDKGISCTDLASFVGEPIFGHRVVSLSREFYAMLLSRPENKEDMDELKKLNLPVISLVCCDMYPLEEEIAKEDVTLAKVIEKTDIGGPTMLRAAAKGERIVVCDKNDREKVINWLKEGEKDSDIFKKLLASKAEYTVAKYCMASANYLSDGLYKGIFSEKINENCYGENAYQAPSFVYQESDSILSPDKFKLLTETSLSYNNFCDRDKVMQTMTHISAGFELNFNKRPPYIAIAVKHGNACGVGLGLKPIDAIMKMVTGDVKAIHGGSVFTNFNIDEEIAEALIHYEMKNENRRLLDTVTAPDFSNIAIEILARKKGKCRIVTNPNLANISLDSIDKKERIRYIRDGFLTQPNYTFIPNFKEAIIEGDVDILKKENIFSDLILAWAIGCTSNSNTITIVKDGKLLGNGVGQQDRVGAAKLAIERADDASKALKDNNERADLSDTIAYSDSFFPFPDGPKVLIDRGVKIIFATSGSVNDKIVIDSCKQQGATLVMFPDKEARGFAWH